MNNDVAPPDAVPHATVPHALAPHPALADAAPRPAVADAVPHPDPRGAEARGCLFALSQPPLMLFLTVIGVLLLFTALYDLSRW